MTSWTEQDFDHLDWHDSHVHGMIIRQGVNGTGELVLDLDYIVQCVCLVRQRCEFLVAPATLTFREVTDLKIRLDYEEPSAAIGPFSIAGIEREVMEYPNGHRSYRWHIPLNWPDGEIRFVGLGFVQVLRASPIQVSAQFLSVEQRESAEGGAS